MTQQNIIIQPILGRQPAEVGEVKHAVELEIDENGVEGQILKFYHCITLKRDHFHFMNLS